MAGLISYANGTKETWRGTIWNLICERIPKAERRVAVGVYLCGPDDFDRVCAVKRGFCTENLVAVDIDRSCITNVRKAGGIGIVGSLQDVIATWNHGPIRFVIADFVSGMTDANTDLYLAAAKSHWMGRNTIMAVNMLRGRDQDNNAFQEQLRSQLSQATHSFRRFFGDRKLIRDPLIHRGVQFLWAMASDLGRFFHNLNPAIDRTQVTYELLARSSPTLGSYKSGPQVFDWVVCNWIVEPEDTTSRPSPGEMAGYSAMRAQRKSSWRMSPFDNQSYVARHAALCTARDRCISGHSQ